MERQQFAKTNRGEYHGKTPPSLKAVLPARTAVSPLVKLQRNLGNQAFGRFFQAKLTVNQPGDIYEQEADRVAEQVMRMPEPLSGLPSSDDSNPHVQKKCAACASGGSPCPQCAEEEAHLQRKPLITPPLKGGGGMLQRQEMENSEEEEEGTLQAKEAPGAVPAVSPTVENHINAMRGGGQPLPLPVRAFFEPRFGYDFSQVRVHTDGQAAESARAVNARAYTVGRDVVFGAAEYSPDSAAGKSLLAHELTHVVQQKTAVLLDRVHGKFSYAKEVPVKILPSKTHTALIQREDLPDAGVGPADAGVGASVAEVSVGSTTDDTIIFEDMTFSLDAQRVRETLEQYISIHGQEATNEFVARFEQHLDRKRLYLSDVHGTPDWIEPARRELSNLERIAPIVRAKTSELRQENDIFLDEFEAQAKLVLSMMLNTSEERIRSEMERYGLSEKKILASRISHSGGGFGEQSSEIVFHSEYHIANNAGTQGLATAARPLVAKAREIRSLVVQQNSLINIRYTKTEKVIDTTDWDRFGALERQITTACRDYNILRNEKERDFPILASFAPLPTSQGLFYIDQVIERLSGIAGDPSTGLAGTLYNDAAEKLRNIQTVWEGMKSDDLPVWKLPSVIDLTKRQMNVSPGTIKHKLVVDRISAVESEGNLVNIALGVLAIALGALAAIPTGGSSLVAGVAFAGAVGSAAVSTYLASEHLHQYTLEAAAAGTDFDKARAISQTEPSLFWLALDLVGAGMDIFAAGAAFRTLTTTLREALAARRAARAGQATAESEEALNRLIQAGDQYQPGLGRRLANDVIHRQPALEAESVLAHWEGSLNQRTRGYLVDHPETRVLYTDMDPDVRWVLTHCSENCIIPNATRGDVARVRKILNQLGTNESARLQLYFHIKRNDLSAAIKELETVSDPAEMRNLLERTLKPASHIPSSGQIIKVNLNKYPDVVPEPPVVLEFPDGTRVWRDTPGGPVRHKSTLRPRPGRQDLEKKFFSAKEHGKLPTGPRYERAHTLGQGTGFESPYGIYYAPRYVNQNLQNNGIELYMRQLVATQPSNTSYRLVTSTSMIRRQGLPIRNLGEIHYQVEVIVNGVPHPFFEYTIRVTGSAKHPQVGANAIRFANNPIAQTHRQAVSVPDILLQNVNRTL